jgi:hypothetical protein
MTPDEINGRLVALRLLPLNDEQTWILRDPREREQRALMLTDLRDRCALPLTDEEFAQLMR